MGVSRHPILLSARLTSGYHEASDNVYFYSLEVNGDPRVWLFKTFSDQSAPYSRYLFTLALQTIWGMKFYLEISSATI
jgi:hypothetical protein